MFNASHLHVPNTIIQTAEAIAEATEFIGKLEEPRIDYSEAVNPGVQKAMKLSSLLGCNTRQATLFSILLRFTLEGDESSTLEICKFLHCSPFERIVIDADMKDLVKLGLVQKRNNNRRRKSEAKYLVPDKIIENISTNKALPINVENVTDNFSLLDRLSACFREYHDEEVTVDELLDTLYLMRETYSNMDLYSTARQYCKSPAEEILLTYIFVASSGGYDAVDMCWALNKFFHRSKDRAEQRSAWTHQRVNLFTAGLVELVPADFRGDLNVRFTTKGIKAVYGKEAELINAREIDTGLCSLKKFSEIKEKNLFYNPSEAEGIQMIRNVIMPEKFRAMQERLAHYKLPVGVTALLHGAPGTGKTESVMQLARETGRDVLMVDISQIRDKWVGESEKRLMSVFSSYRHIVATVSPCPILLFNESDALIGKRLNVNSSVDQMNNIMQNVLLQELEGFNGIFMATTNLTMNLDRAFERRFLFKVHFQKPIPEARVQIWKEKMSFLNEEEAFYLSHHYEFSGGQIENIHRKTVMHDLLEGKMPELNALKKFCEEELFNTKSEPRKIGFR